MKKNFDYKNNRNHLFDKTRINQKLEQLLGQSQKFQEKINQSKAQFPNPKPFNTQIEETNEDKLLQGRDFTVCIRARPLLPHELQAGYFDVVTANNPDLVFHNSKFNVQQKPVVEDQKFNVDLSFGPQDNNEVVYQQIGRPLVKLALDGGFGSMFAYGQTGSGKTFTMQGIQERISREIFQMNQNGSEIYVGFFQLLGNKASDLIDTRIDIEIQEDTFGKVQTQNMQEFQVNNTQEFLGLIQKAQANRRTQATFKNDVSSRTHSICQIRVKNPNMPSADDGLMYLIDLVGSENASDSQFHDKELFNETKDINKSLMALKECIRNRVLASVQNRHIHIPFRNSKLTLLLKDSFDMNSFRQSKTVVIANISPSCADQTQTINTLKYASPIKVTLNGMKRSVINPHNPQFWNNDILKEYISFISKQVSQKHNNIDVEAMFPYESGKQALQLNEHMFIQKFLDQGFPEKQAKDVYSRFFKKFIDTRFSDRQKQQNRVGKVLQEADNDQNQNQNVKGQNQLQVLMQQWEKENKDLIRRNQIKKHANKSHNVVKTLKNNTNNVVNKPVSQQRNRVQQKQTALNVNKTPVNNQQQKMEEEPEIQQQDRSPFIQYQQDRQSFVQYQQQLEPKLSQQLKEQRQIQEQQQQKRSSLKDFIQEQRQQQQQYLEQQNQYNQQEQQDQNYNGFQQNNNHQNNYQQQYQDQNQFQQQYSNYNQQQQNYYGNNMGQQQFHQQQLQQNSQQQQYANNNMYQNNQQQFNSQQFY